MHKLTKPNHEINVAEHEMEFAETKNRLNRNSLSSGRRSWPCMETNPSLLEHQA